MTKNLIYELTKFKETSKFSDTKWKERGLNPSPKILCEQMNSMFNQIAENLIQAVEQNANQKHQKRIFKEGLNRFKKISLDTEEKEFVCDYFFELSQKLEVNFNDNLNKWMYGSFLVNLIKIRNFFSKPK